MDPAATLMLFLAVAADGQPAGIDPTLGVIVAAALSCLAALIASWLTNRVAGRANQQTAVFTWAEQLRASEQAARDRAERIRDEADADVAQLRQRLDDLDAKLRKANVLAGQLADTLTMVAAEVWRPEPNIEALRRLVGRPVPPGRNGRSH